MAFTPGTYKTYETIGIREDLSDMITNISPQDTLFYNAIGSVNVTQTKHEWQTDALESIDTSNQQLEGDAYATAAVTPTTRLYNTAEIQAKTFRISGTDEAVKSAGRQSETNYQSAKILKELARDIEYDFLHAGYNGGNGSQPGDGTTARIMKGLDHWIVTNVDVPGDGTLTTATGNYAAGTARALTESMLASVLQDCFTSGGSPSTVYVGAFNKRQVSSFSGSGNYRTTVDNKTLETAIDIYVGDFGSVKIVPHRHMIASRALIVDHSYYKKGTLRPVQKVELGRLGDSVGYLITVEHTLEASASGNESGQIFDLTTS